MTQKEIETLYGWLEIKTEDKITGTWLKEHHGKLYHSGSAGKYYFDCTPRGVKTRHSREMTWGEVAKALQEIQTEKAERETAMRTTVEQDDPDIIDAEYREVENVPAQEAAETLCDTCEHEGECAGKKTHDDSCMGYEEKEQEGELETITQELEAEPDWEGYGRRDVASLLDKYNQYLEAGRREKCPQILMKNHRIIVDALTILLEQIDSEYECGEIWR